MGQQFIEGTMPKIADALERIAKALETSKQPFPDMEEQRPRERATRDTAPVVRLNVHGQPITGSQVTSVSSVDSMTEAFEQMRKHGLIPQEGPKTPTPSSVALRSLRDDASSVFALLDGMVEASADTRQRAAWERLSDNLRQLYYHD